MKFHHMKPKDTRPIYNQHTGHTVPHIHTQNNCEMKFVSPGRIRRPSLSCTVKKRGKRRHPVQNVVDLVNPFLFFQLVTKKPQVGRDFIREMSIPVSSDNTVFLPLNVRRLPPGRCIMLSPFGHKSVLEFHCGSCRKAYHGIAEAHFSALLSGHQISTSHEVDEVNSLPLTVFNNASKVIQHKLFYLSLLSQSMDTMRANFKQPGLFYAYFTLAKFCPGGCPIFRRQANTGLLRMITVYRSTSVHIGDTCLQSLCENLPEYKISIDTVNKVYYVSIEPREKENKNIALNEDAICEAVASLDCSDELRQELSTVYELV
ncbi:hypothetical protein [Vombatid gammaherpesvirus 1]|uniref:Nuclear egress protein 1 n=1 Tax=Vombatid gammaherpesvirus 1 TaxID=2052651 RepID=A0A3S8D7Q0_9GAMA|nr:hypothetical protein KM710_gp64 [Vombatid gammaherpesvirus 1]AZB49169.1 hypothetical protein [Vombatid gammaherpesvirus 1]